MCTLLLDMMVLQQNSPVKLNSRCFFHNTEEKIIVVAGNKRNKGNVPKRLAAEETLPLGKLEVCFPQRVWEEKICRHTISKYIRCCLRQKYILIAIVYNNIRFSTISQVKIYLCCDARWLHAVTDLCLIRKLNNSQEFGSGTRCL